MRVSETHSENRNFSVPKAGAIGAALGYAGTYIVPLTTEEHAHYFTDSVKKGIEKKALSARKNEIATITEELKDASIKPLVKDVFEKNKKALENNPAGVLKKLSKNTTMETGSKKALHSLYKRVQNTGKMTEMIENAMTSFAAKKDSRAGLYYALIGGLALMSFAVLKNGLDALLPPKKEQKPEKAHEMTTFDYIIDSAEVPGEIYIFGFGKGKK